MRVGSILTPERNKKDINVHIFDARPKLAAMGNMLKGKGYENMEYYTNCELTFNKIDNAPTMQGAYDKMGKGCLEYEADGFWEAWSSSQWPLHLSRILKMSVLIIHSMYKGVTPIVHCSDGWDRTPQVCSLVQLLIDPYFRTLRGFISLVEKDWGQFGHQFALRNGIASVHKEDKERSPVFLQFMDCIHQIMNQFPTAFEFNMEFLKELAHHSYTGVFGNFLCDNHRDRVKNNLKDKTVSIWSYVLDQEAKFKNGFYIHNPEVLWVNTLPINMRFWREHFLQYAPVSSLFGELPIGEPITDFYKKIVMRVKEEGNLKDYM